MCLWCPDETKGLLGRNLSPLAEATGAELEKMSILVCNIPGRPCCVCVTMLCLLLLPPFDVHY